jgi:hypothetical protein
MKLRLLEKQSLIFDLTRIQNRCQGAVNEIGFNSSEKMLWMALQGESHGY